MNSSYNSNVESNLEQRQGGLFSGIAWLRDLALSAVFAILLIVFLYQPVKVEGTSMMPSLTNEERIFINKFTYKIGSGKIDRGDTVVFLFPEDKSKSYIKRVIGVPGDRIQIDEGRVIVNGAALDEPYVPEDYRDRMSKEERVVPKDCYFVMGDHRNSSNDSRAWGYVPKNLIYGKAEFVYWPLDKIGRVR